MGKTILIFVLMLASLSFSYSQSSQNPSILYEWHVQNTGSNTGERTIATIDADSTGLYVGTSVVGEIVDAVANWGNNMPIVASFRLFAQFSSGRNFQLIQDAVTPSVTLRLKSISPTKTAIVAYCPAMNRQIKIFFRVASSVGTRIAIGDPNTLTTVGTIITEPTYISNLWSKMTINVDNNIKTTGYTLAVGGKAVAESVTVKMKSAWPDYVFSSDYPLLTLTDIKEYITRHQRLPEFPSENQIRNNGLDLGEMNRLLTKKVEELFLYLIQTHDKEQEQEIINKELKQTVITLQSELNELKMKIGRLEKK